MPDEFGNPLPGEETEASQTILNTPVDTTMSASSNPTGTGDTPAIVAPQLNTPANLGASSSDYDQYSNPIDRIQDIDIKSASEYMTPETTVAGQLERLLARDNEIAQQGRVRAREQASALGLMSSSAAIGAGRREELKALSPIAAADAESAAKFGLQQQATENQIGQIQSEAEVSGALAQQKSALSERQAAISQQWEATIKNFDKDTQEFLYDKKGEWDAALKELEGDITKELQNQEIDAAVEKEMLAQAHENMNNYQISIQNLLANESFLDVFAGDREAMNQVFDDMFRTVKTSMVFTSRASGVYGEPGGEGVADYIDELVAGNLWGT